MKKTIIEQFRSSLNSLISSEHDMRKKFKFLTKQLVEDFANDHVAARKGKVYEATNQGYLKKQKRKRFLITEIRISTMPDDSYRSIRILAKGGPELVGYVFISAIGYWLGENGYCEKPGVMNLPFNSDRSGKSTIDPSWPRRMYYLADMELSKNQKFTRRQIKR